MLLGNWSAAGAPPAYPTAAAVARAEARLRAFAFVGLFERWADSVCLFAATFGSFVTAGDLVNTRPGARARAALAGDARGGGEADAFPDVDDWADARLYAVGARLFEDRLRAAFAVD